MSELNNWFPERNPIHRILEKLEARIEQLEILVSEQKKMIEELSKK